MIDFIASLSIYISIMWTVSWPLSPLLLIIQLPLQGSYNREALAKLLSGLLVEVVLVSLAVQLTLDHQNRHGDFSSWYPWVTAIILFVHFNESAIDNRANVIEKAWIKDPKFLPELRFWKVYPAVSMPIFLFFYAFPKINTPYVYHWYNLAVEWIFHIRFIGFVLEVTAAFIGVKLLWGSIIFLFMRIVSALTRSSELNEIE